VGSTGALWRREGIKTPSGGLLLVGNGAAPAGHNRCTGQITHVGLITQSAVLAGMKQKLMLGLW